MPFDSVSIKVVQDANANLIAVTIVRLSFRSGLLTAKDIISRLLEKCGVCVSKNRQSLV